MYKIKEISRLAGITTRTLRYYDSINLFSPSHIGDNQYRYYSEADIDKLQQIMYYKELDLNLNEIKRIMDNKDYNVLDALHFHKDNLLKKKKRIESLIDTLDKTIRKEKGEAIMSNEDKFRNLKEKLIEENEVKYGSEINDKYGSNEVNASYQKIRKMSKWEFNEAQRLEKEILDNLRTALASNNPKSDLAQKVCELHQKWFKMYWNTYSKEAHLSLVTMYTQDERFTKYYDKVGSGATTFLFEAMNLYLKKNH